MILGLGCDIVQVSRFLKIEDFFDRFTKKYLTIREVEEINQRNAHKNKDTLMREIAVRFAAKEAVSKALGSGFRNGITLKDIELTHDELGCPRITLYQQALSRAYQMSKNQQFNIHITLSDEQEYVNAVAVIESL